MQVGVNIQSIPINIATKTTKKNTTASTANLGLFFMGFLLAV